MSEKLAIRTLGSLTIECDGEPVTGFDQRKVPALLVYLACTQRAHPREVLAEMFWEERTQSQALSNLRGALTNLRQTVAPYVEITRETVGMHPTSAWWVDVAEFESQLDSASTEMFKLTAAVDLYQGDFLQGFYVDSSAFENWATRECERLRLRAMEALDTLIALHLESGDYIAGITQANQLLNLGNLREKTHRQLVELLWRSGERIAALTQYETCRRLLVDELGIEPSVETTALYERIKAGETPDERRLFDVRGYELRDRIGEGSFGEVYRAYQPIGEGGREVAIKVIKPDYANQPDFVRRFEVEAQVIARLEHQNIVPLYDYWREPSGAYLVMRFLRESLLARLQRAPLTVSECVRLVEQVAAALATAHANGVIHRDLKPANVLLDGEGNAYLTDFGLAKVLGPALKATHEGAMVGSPGYLSPEQIKSEPVTAQSDIYSFGVLLYEALTGVSPYPGDLTPAALIHKHLTEPLPSLLDARPDLPPGLDTVIQQATAKAPSSRYQTVLELAAGFRDVAGTAGLRVSTDEAVAPVTERLVPDVRTWTPADSLIEKRNPYKGLNAFYEADAEDFFGRDALVERLLGRLAEQHPLARFLAIVGPSGSGKSSVARAGLLAALHDGAVPGSETWYSAVMLPGTHPVDELEIALSHISVNSIPDLHEQLQRDARGLVRAVRMILPETSELVLLIDQFEELFLMADDPATVCHLLNLIAAAVTDPRSCVRVVVTLRADFYDRPLLYADFGDLLRQRTEVVLPLTGEELERAIVGPAEGVGIHIEPALTSAIVAEISEQPGALPMLQYALTELFERRTDLRMTLDAYHDLGGVLGVLSQQADAVYHHLTGGKQREAARQLFLRLVTLGEGAEDTRRRTLQAELLSVDGTPIQEVIDAFAHARLITLDHDPITRGPTVEVAHEAILREWGQLRDWLDESRHDIRQQRVLAASAKEWLNAGKDSSYLLRGTRLAEFEEWTSQTGVALTANEYIFLDISINEEERSQTTRRRIRNMLLATAFVVAIIMAVLAIIATDAQSTAEDERDKAQQARDDARREANVSQSVALAVSAQEALLTYDTDLAIALALEANAIEDPPVEARQVLANAVFAPGTRHVLSGHEGPVSAVAFSPDGMHAATAGGRRWSYEVSGAYEFFDDGFRDFSVRLWDLETGEEERRLVGHSDAVWDVAFSPDGKTILSASGDQSLILWNVETGTEIRRLMTPHKARRVVFRPDGRTALSASGGVLILWDVTTGENIRQLTRTNAYPIWSLAISPDGRYALAGEKPPGMRTAIGVVTLWDLETGDMISLYDLEGASFALAFSPDGQTALIGSHESAPSAFGVDPAQAVVIHLDLATGQEIHRLYQGGAFIAGVAFSPDGSQAIVSTIDTAIVVWDLNTGASIQRLRGHEEWLTAMALSPDGSQVLTGAEDNTARLWDLRSGTEVRRLVSHTSQVHTINVSPDGRMAVSGGADRAVIMWDLETGDMVHRMLGHESTVVGAYFSPDGTQIISGGKDKTIRFWDVATGQEIRHLVTDLSLGSLSITPDGRYAFVAVAVQDVKSAMSNRLELWDLEAGEVIRQYVGHILWPTSVDVSPNGLLGLSASNDSTVRLWNLDTREEVARYTGHRGNIWHATFSPDGRMVLSGSQDQRLILWDLDSGEEVLTLEGHSGGVASAAISPDSKTALSAGNDQLVILWDLETGREIRRFVGHIKTSFGLAYLPDGRHALSGDYYGDIIMWRLTDTDTEVIAWAYKNRHIREFTCLERERYNIEPGCPGDGQPVPTRTPYPTLTANPAHSVTPILDVARTTVTRIWTPIATPTGAPTFTPLPTATLEAVGQLTPGVPHVGQIIAGRGDQPSSRDRWTYDGSAGEVINITNQSLGVSIDIFDPSGELLAESSTPGVGPLLLPATGTYTIVVYAGSNSMGGQYTLTLTTE